MRDYEQDHIVARVFRALNAYLVGGEGCPVPSQSLGECSIVDGETPNGLIYACVQWWSDAAPDWRKLAEIVRQEGGQNILIQHALLDEVNGDYGGRGVCGASLTIEFLPPGHPKIVPPLLEELAHDLAGLVGTATAEVTP